MKNMDPTTSRPLTDDELHALVDGQTPAASRQALEDRLARDPDAQARVAQWRQQRVALRGLHPHVLDATVPPSLMAAAQRVATARQDVNQWWRWGGMAAGVLLAFGVGWLSHTAWSGSGQLSASVAQRDFVRQAGFAYAVYAPEVKHPVEVTSAEQEHLAQWLSKRTGRPLKIPKLNSEGFELVGGRLLPGEQGARAQFMFQNAQGIRVTLYLGSLGASVKGPDSRETAFSFAPDGPVPSFYWVDQGFGYAITGAVHRNQLMKLAELVYRQL
jgi:anti-sigma factor RsiW